MIFAAIGSILWILILLFVVFALTGNVFFVVKQQHAVIIERLGKFNKIVGAGFHAKIPFVDRKAATVSLRTMKNGFDIDVKTEDNVTIGLEVSAQYHVSYELGSTPEQSGVYKSYYMLQQPVAQMRDFITDALHSRRGLCQEGRHRKRRQRHRVRADGRLRLHPCLDAYHQDRPSA